MLDNNDKKWITETIDERLNKRLAEQEERLTGNLNATMDKRFAEQEERLTGKLNATMDKRFAEQEERLTGKLNAVMDERFADAITTFEQRIDERFDRFERHFDLKLENEIMPMIRLYREVFPSAGKTYVELEDRVDALELKQDVLQNALKARL